MTKHEQLNEIYNELPKGAKNLAAKKVGITRSYFPMKIRDSQTSIKTLNFYGECISKASEEVTKETVTKNEIVQKKVKEFLSKH